LKIDFDHFSILAPFYEFFIHPTDPQKLSSLVPEIPQGKLLDAGGGTGRVSQFLRAKAAQIIIADGSYKMLREARKKEWIQTTQSCTESLPFKDCFFDCIIMVDALHHVANQSETASELWRVLKPGGLIIIEEPNIHTLRVKLLAIAEKLALMRSHFLSPEQIVELFDGTNSRKHIELVDTMAWVVIEK
jgi:demethylmenaquinone methyltransferase/2-methoxy-6-polyprenyl-1,4-benzoquinol methylase